MQIVSLELDHDNFHCPVTGQQIFGDDTFHPSPATRGVWHSMAIEDTTNVADPDLAERWRAHMDRKEAEDGFLDLDKFLRSVDKPNHICFSLTSGHMACGPVWANVWIVINMNYDAGEAPRPNRLASAPPL